MARQHIILVVNNIRSAHNVGSIFRTADAVGVEKIYLCGYTPRPTDDRPRMINGKIAKTALGAEKYIPWEYRRDAWRLLGEFGVKGVRLVALEQSGNSRDIFKYKIPRNGVVALVVGNEVHGLSARMLQRCDDIVEIPMYGKKESLNVAVATGIALYALKNK